MVGPLFVALAAVRALAARAAVLTQLMFQLVFLTLLITCDPSALDPTREAGDRTGRRQAQPRPLLQHQPELGDYLELTHYEELPASQRDALFADAPSQRARVVFLAVDGLSLSKAGWSDSNARDNTTPILQTDEAVIPPFDHTPYKTTGQGRAQVIDALSETLLQHFAPFELHFVTDRPAEGDYTMIALGGVGADVGLDYAPAGIAPLDLDDRNANDVGFVFTAQFADAGYTTGELATFVAHELGHTLGLAHIDRAEDVMFPLACHCVTSFGAGLVIDADGKTTTSEQDDLELLARVLLPRGAAAADVEVEPVCADADSLEPDNLDAPVTIGMDEATPGLRCEGDDDFWRLDAQAAEAIVGCELVTDVTFAHADGNLWLKMVRADGTVGARAYSADDDERTVELITEAGPPVARVGAGSTVTNDYELTFSAHCADAVSCEDGGDLHEPNDTGGLAATRLYAPAGVLGAVCEGDVDHYRFFAKSGCTAEVALLFTDEEGDLNLRVTTHSGETLGRSVSISDDEHVSIALERTRMLYVRVYGYAGATNRYRLDVSTTCD